MCCCPEPNVNGTPGYSWEGKQTMTRRPDAPALNDSDQLICDEPGRCGHGVGDAHSHHFRIVKQAHHGYALLVRHGGGDERLELSVWAGREGNAVSTLLSLDSNARYAMLHTLYSVAKDAALFARNAEAHSWRTAAAEKRIKTRKARGIHNKNVRVWIEAKQTV